MHIKLWGVRGSLPYPLKPIEVERRVSQTLRNFFASGRKSVSEIDGFLADLPPAALGGFGGNTPCVEVRTPDSVVIIDAGSGLRALGRELMEGPLGQGKGRVDFLMTHFHWDHLLGLPFFAPLFVKGNQIHFHAVQEDLPQVIHTLFKRPFFPLDVVHIPSTLSFHQLKPREQVEFGDLKIAPYQLDHPDPCWGYKIEHGKHVYSHCVDSETSRFSRQELGPDLPLYQNVDLMVFDAQYTLMESIRHENWGHGSAMVGLDLAMREEIPQVIFMHHDPFSTDENIVQAELETRRYYEIKRKESERNRTGFFDVNWSFAQEEMVITL